MNEALSLFESLFRSLLNGGMASMAAIASQQDLEVSFLSVSQKVIQTKGRYAWLHAVVILAELRFLARVVYIIDKVQSSGSARLSDYQDRSC